MLDQVTMLVFSAACALSDIETAKIPNSLILCGISCGVLSRVLRIICIFTPGLSGEFFTHNEMLSQAARTAGRSKVMASAALAVDGAAGMMLPVVLIGWMAALKMMGGGDVKLLAALGLMSGAHSGLKILLLSLILAAVYSGYLVIRRKNLGKRLRRFCDYMTSVVRAGRALPYPRDGDDSSGEFCMAVPIFAAAVIWCIEQAAV